VVHRLADKGLSALIGVSLFAYVRAHHRLQGVSLFDLRDTQTVRTARTRADGG
jgi:hypothetical protein